MFKVKYYQKDKLIGDECFSTLEKAEDSLFTSPYSSQGDYYEIIDRSTDKIVQEFMIPTFDLSYAKNSTKELSPWNRNLDLLDWPEEDE